MFHDYQMSRICSATCVDVIKNEMNDCIVQNEQKCARCHAKIDLELLLINESYKQLYAKSIS